MKSAVTATSHTAKGEQRRFSGNSDVEGASPTDSRTRIHSRFHKYQRHEINRRGRPTGCISPFGRGVCTGERRASSSLSRPHKTQPAQRKEDAAFRPRTDLAWNYIRAKCACRANPPKIHFPRFAMSLTGPRGLFAPPFRRRIAVPPGKYPRPVRANRWCGARIRCAANQNPSLLPCAPRRR